LYTLSGRGKAAGLGPLARTERCNHENYNPHSALRFTHREHRSRSGMGLGAGGGGACRPVGPADDGPRLLLRRSRSVWNVAPERLEWLGLYAERGGADLASL